MRELMVLFVAIVALNLAYGTFLALMELRRSRKVRREVGTLEAMWRLDPRGPVRTGRRSVPSLRSALVAAASLVVISGVAVASPDARDAVSSVTAVIGDLIAPSEGEAASPTEEGSSPAATSASSPTEAARSRAGDQSGAVAHEVAPGREEPPTMSPVPPSDGAPSPAPGNEAVSSSPPIDDGPTPINQDPTPTDAPQFEATIGPISSTTVQVTWTTVPSATSYWVERSPGGVNEWSLAAEATADATSATIDLDPGTAYDVRVTAVLADGTEQTPTISVPTPGTVP